MTFDFNLSAGGATYVNLYNDQNQSQSHNQQQQQPQNANANPPLPHQHQHQQQLALQRRHHPHHPHPQQPDHTYAYANANMTNTRNWVSMSSPEAPKPNSPQSQSSSPHSQSSSLQHSPFQSNTNPLTPWALHQQQQQVQAQQSHQQRQYQQHTHQDQSIPADMSQFIPDPLMGFNTYSNMPSASLEYYPPTTTQTALAQASLLESAFTGMPQMTDATHAMHWGNAAMHNWDDFNQTLQLDGLAPMNGSLGSTSPAQSLLEVVSLPSSHGESGWGLVNFGQPFSQSHEHVFNPSETLHLRTNSDSSEGAKSMDIGSFEEIPPWGHSPFSPESDGNGSDSHNHRNCYSSDGHHHHVHDNAGPSAPHQGLPMPIKTEPVSARHSPGSGAGSSPSSNNSRRNSGPRKSPTNRSPIAKSTTKVIRRTSNGKKDGAIEKKVGRRKGPLLPEQRKQASEIRKLRACLRCKFLKKTCDKGEPCTGCQPSHARLWQVPCTRIDIKDIGYFLKD